MIFNFSTKMGSKNTCYLYFGRVLYYYHNFSELPHGALLPPKGCKIRSKLLDLLQFPRYLHTIPYGGHFVFKMRPKLFSGKVSKQSTFCANLIRHKSTDIKTK